MQPRKPSAFSLIEVTLAIAIVGFSVVTILGLLAGLARCSADARDRLTAIGLADAITVQLRAAAVAHGWDGLVARTAPGSEEGAFRLTARRDGTGLRAVRPAGSSRADQFFLIEVRRFSAGSLAFAPGDAAMAVTVVVSWPYRPATPDGSVAEVPAGERAQLEFTVGVNR